MRTAWTVLIMLTILGVSQISHANLFGDDSLGLLEAYHRDQIRIVGVALAPLALAEQVHQYGVGRSKRRSPVARPILKDAPGIHAWLEISQNGFTTVEIDIDSGVDTAQVEAKLEMSQPHSAARLLERVFRTRGQGLRALETTVTHLRRDEPKYEACHLKELPLCAELSAAEKLMRKAAEHSRPGVSDLDVYPKVEGIRFHVNRSFRCLLVSEAGKQDGFPRRPGKVVLGFNRENYRLRFVRTTYGPGVLR